MSNARPPRAPEGPSGSRSTTSGSQSWLASERSAQSKVPVAFWYMSLIGGLITLAYAIYRRDPVFIAGQSVGAVVYIRNLMLIYKPVAPDASSLAPPPST